MRNPTKKRKKRRKRGKLLSVRRVLIALTILSLLNFYLVLVLEKKLGKVREHVRSDIIVMLNAYSKKLSSEITEIIERFEKAGQSNFFRIK